MNAKKTLVVLICLTGFLFAQARSGNDSFSRVRTARVMTKGGLEAYNDLMFYSKVGKLFSGNIQTLDSLKNAIGYWNVASNISISYGINEHFDVTLSPRIYQDTQLKKVGNLPDDIFISVKTGSWGLFNNLVNYGGILSTRIGTAEVHNIPFAPYSAGTLEFGFMGLVSYYFDPAFPENGFNAHLNLGYLNHNDADAVLLSSTTAEWTNKDRSSEFQYGIAFKYPTAGVDLQIELWGVSWLTPPSPQAYSRENYTYITPSIRYKPYSWIGIDLGFDLRISSDEDNTVYIPGVSHNYSSQGLPNYESWRMKLGFNLVILPLKVGSKAGTEYRQLEQRKEIFKQLIQSKSKVESAERELESLKQARKEAEKELEELKKILEEKPENPPQ